MLIVEKVWNVLVVFFFFKQKTAYEMRISDWSSDVCSSDLPTTFPVRPNQEPPSSHACSGSTTPPWCSCCGPGCAPTRRPGTSPRKPTYACCSSTASAPCARPADLPPFSGPLADRKRVVEGKRVSVRLDLGGRRLIKK